MGKIYKFGILGCGNIANTHADALKNIANAELIGVADNKKEFAVRFAEKNNVKAYDTYEEMLNDKEIDIVCICTPSGFHAQNAILAIEHEKNVILEKPMALTLEEADTITDALKKHNSKLTVILPMRFSEDIVKAKKLVEENAFGKITLCDLTMKYYRDDEYFKSSPWRGTKKLDGGGALMNQGIHGIDAFEFILGGIKNVKGVVKTLHHKIEVEDTAVAMVEFNNGALGVIVGSTCSYPGFERVIRINGTKGYLVLKEDKIIELMINNEKVEINNEPVLSNSASTAVVSNSTLHRLQIENMINYLDGKEDLFINAEDGKMAIRVIEEIYKSSNN